MPRLTVTFNGICVHLAKSSTDALPVPYRVVIPQSGTQIRNGVAIGRLAPTVKFTPALPATPGGLVPDGDAFALDAVTLAITSTNPQVPVPVIPSDLPSIKAMAVDVPDFTIDPAVALATTPPRGGYFDIATSGTVNIVSPDPPLVTRLTVDVPASGAFTLAVAQANALASFTFFEDLSIDLRNVPKDSNDPSLELLFSFLGVSTSIPADARHEGFFVESWRSDPGNPGCSNSQWP